MNNVSQKMELFTPVHNLPALKSVISSIVQETSYLAQEAIEYTADVLFDCSRALNYSSEWVEYSKFSPEVKESAARVKGATERFNLFASFCEAYMAGKNLVTNQMESVFDAIDSIGGYIGANLDFAGRLDEFNIVSLGELKPYVGGVGSLADASVGMNGIREVLQDPEIGKSWTSSLLKLAKNVALVALATLGAVASYFTTFAATVPHMSFYLLTAATAFLAIKVTGVFYDKVFLSPAVALKA